MKQEEKAKQLKDDEEKVEEEIGDETKEGEAEDCHAASTYSRWKENMKSLVEGVGGGGGGSRRVGVNPQGQAPPHIFSCTT